MISKIGISVQLYCSCGSSLLREYTIVTEVTAAIQCTKHTYDELFLGDQGIPPGEFWKLKTEIKFGGDFDW